MRAKSKTAASQPTTIDEYIAGFTPRVQSLLRKVRATVRKAAPDAIERIAYQMPTYRLHGNLVHFAAFKNHIGFYPTPRGIEEFQQDLAPYESGKGSAQFPLDQPLPLDLIRRIVEFRVAENVAQAVDKTKAKKKPPAKR